MVDTFVSNITVQELTEIPHLNDLLDNLISTNASEVLLRYDGCLAKAEVIVDGVPYTWLNFKQKPELIRGIIHGFQARISDGYLHHFCQSSEPEYTLYTGKEASYKVKESSPDCLKLEAQKLSS